MPTVGERAEGVKSDARTRRYPIRGCVFDTDAGGVRFGRACRGKISTVVTASVVAGSIPSPPHGLFLRIARSSPS